jgi:hypothetical protein
MKGWNPSPRLGCLCQLPLDRHGKLVTRPSLRPVSLCHCLIRKANSFLYAWPSFAICAVTFPVRSRKKKWTKTCANQPGGKRSGKPSRRLRLRPRPALIPIVTTADTVDAVELAQTYTRRWPVQENIIRDFLVPLGLNTNHGYGKTPIVNSEVARETSRLREAFEYCPALDRFCTSPFPQSLSALWSPLEANQDLWR